MFECTKDSRGRSPSCLQDPNTVLRTEESLESALSNGQGLFAAVNYALELKTEVANTTRVYHDLTRNIMERMEGE